MKDRQEQDTSAWEEKYRPETFGEFFGQERAVQLLTNIAHAKRAGAGTARGPHLLLQGAVGSGKTSLLRVLARAINCDRPGSDCSPCQHCPSCQDATPYLKEYNVPSFRNDVERVRSIVEHAGARLAGTKLKMVFFDEAHHLSRKAQDILLKSIEEADPRLMFCFATTDRTRICAALQSRLLEVEIWPLAPEASLSLLKHIGSREGVEYDADALQLLISAVPSQARDLVIALHKLSQYRVRIDTRLLKEVMGLSVVDHLTDYVVALAKKDGQMQELCLAEWREAAPIKARYVQRLLLTIFYNDVLGHKVVLDPLCYGMREARWSVVRAFIERLQAKSARDLVPLFERMLEFWSQPLSDDDHAATLRFVLFQQMVNQEPPMKEASDDLRESNLRGGVRLVQENALDTGIEIIEPAPGEKFLALEEVRQIINRSSYLVQAHGVHWNVFALIENPAIRLLSEREIFTDAVGCLDSLNAIRQSSATETASMLLVERSGHSVEVRIAAHLPEVEQSGDWVGLLEWNRHLQSQGKAIVVETGTAVQPASFHWRATMELCASYDESECQVGKGLSLREKLGIRSRRWRHPGPFEAPRLVFGHLATSAAIEKESRYGMKWLSAYDVEAWSAVTSGWEGEEFRDRVEEVQAREACIRKIQRKHGKDGAAAEEEIKHLCANWVEFGSVEWPRSWRKSW